MTPGSVGVSRWVGIFILLFSYHLRAEVIGYGLTNIAIGQAVLYPQYYDYSVGKLGSNGTDGVSITLGEPEGGIFFQPYVSGLSDGHFMSANTYGRLHQTNDMLLARIWGGRASDSVYPLNLDFSPLAPESITYQIFSGGRLQREFSRGQPMVVVQLGNYYQPVVNPLERRRDGTLGTSINLHAYGAFVFPELLTSAYGDELFIRVNNPANPPGPASRVEVFGGGGMDSFWFHNVSLGAFYRPHRSSGGATLHAAPGSLRLANFVNTNEAAGVIIDLERVASLKLDFEPVQLSTSNSLLEVSALGRAATWTAEFLGSLKFTRRTNRTVIDYSTDWYQAQVTVLSNGLVIHEELVAEPALSLAMDGNVPIAAISAHAKTVENLPGYHVKFSQAAPIIISSNGPAYSGDEIRLGLPGSLRIEHLYIFSLGARDVDSITITNETVTPIPGPPALSIIRSDDLVLLRWPDPNLKYALQESYFYSPSEFYFTHASRSEEFSDPYVTATVPLIKTNKVHFFRLLYNPD